MRLYFLLFFICFTVIYFSTFYLIQVPYSRNYYFSSFQSMCGLYNNPFQIARLHTKGLFTESYIDYTPSDCDNNIPVYTNVDDYWEMLEHPVVGDHIHMGIKIAINNTLYIFHDKNLTKTIKYEKKPINCPSSVDFAYKKQYFHTGVHSHCDRSPDDCGVVHIHPWTAPMLLRPQGREVNLGLFFESIGIQKNTREKGFLVNGSIPVAFNMAYYVNVRNNEASMQTQSDREIMNLWLVDCHAGIVLWDNKSSMPKFTEEDMKYVESYKCYPSNYPTR